MPIEQARSYLTGAFAEVEGWCAPHLWQAIQPLHQAMAERGPLRPVAEIGVYHGKFLIGLALTAGAPANNFAIDVFDLQEFNLDGAGKGSLDKLKENLARSGLPEQQMTFYRVDSMSVGDHEIAEIRRACGGGFSFFSVDGCHTVEHTINDVNIALRLTAHDGVIFVDDYNNPHWPGVQEGVAKMYLMSAPRFVPLLFCCNKLFLCNISFHERYLKRVKSFVEEHFPETRIKMVKRYGYDTITMAPNMNGGDYIATAGA
jgi:hypothetical protein